MDSILTSIKKMLGLTEDYAHFDIDIIIYINDALMTLNQLGVGPEEGFVVTDDTQTWREFLNDSNKFNLEAVKTFVYLNVKMIFDPPTNSSVLESMKRKSDECAWRLNVQVERGGNE